MNLGTICQNSFLPCCGKPVNCSCAFHHYDKACCQPSYMVFDKDGSGHNYDLLLYWIVCQHVCFLMLLVLLIVIYTVACCTYCCSSLVAVHLLFINSTRLAPAEATLAPGERSLEAAFGAAWSLDATAGHGPAGCIIPKLRDARSSWIAFGTNAWKNWYVCQSSSQRKWP